MTVRNAAYFVLIMATLTFAFAQQTRDDLNGDQLSAVKSTSKLSTPDLINQRLFVPDLVLSEKHIVTPSEQKLEGFRAACEVRSGHSRAGGYCI